MWVSLQHKSNCYENTVTSIAFSYATSKVASLYRKIMKAEVETQDKNIFGDRSESQVIKLPKQCPGKLDGIYTRQAKPSFGFQSNTCRNIHLNGVVLRTEFLCRGFIFLCHVLLLLLKQYHTFQSPYNIISCIIMYNMTHEYDTIVWKREAYYVMLNWDWNV